MPDVAYGIDSEQNADEEMIGAISSHQSGGSELFVAAPLGSGDHGPRYDLDNDTYVFQPHYFTRDNKPGGQPSETADITNCHKVGDSAPHIVGIIAQNGSDIQTPDQLGAVSASYARQTSGDLIAFQPRYARNGRGAPDTIAAPLTAEAGRTGKGDSAQCVAFTERTRADGRNLETQDELAYALTNPGDGGRTQERRIAGTWGVRRLTPTECERLQGFPDGWTADQSDSARYRQLGNAVAVPAAAWLGLRIAMQPPQHIPSSDAALVGQLGGEADDLGGEGVGVIKRR